jgi:hypothetical protein
MGNYNPNYFEKKSGSLEEAILNAVNGVKTQIDEKVTEYIELEFKDKQAAINAYKTINNKVYPGGTQPFEDINQEGNSIQLDKVDDAKKVLADFKKVGRLQFKVAVEESVTKEGTKEEYKKFFDAAMKKFGIDSPADLKSDEEKKKFFDYVDKNYKGEKDEAYHAKIKEWSGMNEADDFKTHMMYDPKTGKGYEAKTMDDHLRMKKMGYSHEKPKMEAYEIGTKEYANHTKKTTPGQFESQGEADWNETVVNIQKKQTSMREALAKVWGYNEGKSPFDKEENVKPKKEGKTLTGKPMTKVDVKPDMKEKKN